MPGETPQIVNLKEPYESEVQELRDQYGRNIFITEESGNFRRLLLNMVTEPMSTMWFEIYKLVSGRSSITRFDQIHALN